MTPQDTDSLIARNATTLRALHAAIHQAYKKKPHGPEHHEACAAFRRSYDALAYPGGLTLGLERLEQREPYAVETAIGFLEVDPWFFRSGYIKEELVRRLKHAELRNLQRLRLATVISRSIRHGTGRVARHLARLAPQVYTPEFVAELTLHLQSKQKEPRRRAEHVLKVLRQCHPAPASHLPS